MKKLLAIVLAITLVFALSGCIRININGSSSRYESYSNADKYTVGDFEYDVASIRSLSVDWVAGSVTLIESDSDTLKVYEKGNDLTEDEKLHWSIFGDELVIRYCKSGYVGKLLVNGKKDLVVEVPKNIDVDVDCVSAEISAEDITQNDVEFESVSGKISAKNVDCSELKIYSVSGSITIQNANSADITANSVSGDVDLSGVSTDEISVETISGRADVELSKANRIELSSVSGKVTVDLLGVGAMVEVETTSGILDLDGATVVGRDYKFGDGAAKTRISTVSGGITVKYHE